ncbi:MAG: hypothetical protein ACJAS1_006171 [Oleiphilaceae bacterium]|jgi:hypothetical protein
MSQVDPKKTFIKHRYLRSKADTTQYFGLLYPKSVAYGTLSRKSVRNPRIYKVLFVVQEKALEQVILSQRLVLPEHVKCVKVLTY